MKYLNIQPIRNLQNQSPVFRCPAIDPVLRNILREIIVCVNQEEVAHRFEPPLQPAVDVRIVGLGIVLKESTEEHRP